MGPKKRAEKLIKKFTKRGVEQDAAKEYALITVNQIVKALDDVLFPNPFKQYWSEVKNHIKQL